MTEKYLAPNEASTSSPPRLSGHQEECESQKTGESVLVLLRVDHVRRMCPWNNGVVTGKGSPNPGWMSGLLWYREPGQEPMAQEVMGPTRESTNRSEQTKPFRTSSQMPTHIC